MEFICFSISNDLLLLVSGNTDGIAVFYNYYFFIMFGNSDGIAVFYNYYFVIMSAVFDPAVAIDPFVDDLIELLGGRFIN